MKAPKMPLFQSLSGCRGVNQSAFFFFFPVCVYLCGSTTGRSCVGQISPFCWETWSHHWSFSPVDNSPRHSHVCRARLHTRLSVDGGVVRCNCCRLGGVINQSEWRSSCSRWPERSCAVPAGAKVRNLSRDAALLTSYRTGLGGQLTHA